MPLRGNRPLTKFELFKQALLKDKSEKELVELLKDAEILKLLGDKYNIKDIVHIAISRGDIAIFKLIYNLAIVTETFNDAELWNFELDMASQLDRAEIVEILLENSAIRKATIEAQQCPALGTAARLGHLNVVEKFLSVPEITKKLNDRGTSNGYCIATNADPLLLAGANNKLAVVKRLLLLPGYINDGDHLHQVLYYASVRNAFEVIEYLLTLCSIKEHSMILESDVLPRAAIHGRMLLVEATLDIILPNISHINYPTVTELSYCQNALLGAMFAKQYEIALRMIMRFEANGISLPPTISKPTIGYAVRCNYDALVATSEFRHYPDPSYFESFEQFRNYFITDPKLMDEAIKQVNNVILLPSSTVPNLILDYFGVFMTRLADVNPNATKNANNPVESSGVAYSPNAANASK